MSVDFGTNISHILNYENYFDKNIVSKKDIYNTILKFKPKMYSFNYIDNKIIIKDKKYNNIVIDNKILNTNVHEGIKNSVCLKHDEYRRSLYKEELIYKEFYNLQLNKQNIYLDRINKIALNPFESKRYWIDNINNLPFGYEP